MTPAERADLARVDAEFERLASTVDPAVRGAIPTPGGSTSSVSASGCGRWRRTPAVHRRHTLASLSLSCDGPERTSLLAELRKHAWLPGEAFYDLAAWEGLRCAEGSAAVVERMAAEVGERVRLNAPVAAIAVTTTGVVVTLADGDTVRAEAVICTIPAGPLRAVRITGVSDARLESLRAQRQALAAKLVAAYDEPFWQARGQNGLAECEWLFGSTWPQGRGTLSLLVPPERLSAFLAAPPAARSRDVLDGLARLYGEAAREPTALLERPWGADRFTLGYIAAWAPGDLGRVGPLHGTHEPPFYVAGSDHWVAGYMEGAVATGRAAAREALRDRRADLNAQGRPPVDTGWNGPFQAGCECPVLHLAGDRCAGARRHGPRRPARTGRCQRRQPSGVLRQPADRWRAPATSSPSWDTPR